jgi:outer membrane protein OmpA-like peptidoglycan-associated protein
MRTRKLSGGLVTAALATVLLSCSAGPPPRDIAEARLALQDAKNAGADQRATREYDAASAHLNIAQSTWSKQKDAVAAAHWARLAQAEARQAQYVSEAAAAQEMVSRETERRQRAELAVREAEIAMLQARARTEAEKRAAEIEARARAGQQEAEDALKTTLSQLGQVREEARGLIVTMPGSIYFDVNKAEVKPAMRERLAQVAKALATVGNRRVLVEGHTDSTGADDYNLKLSRLRAESVRSILVAGGVSADRIESQGYGKTRPVASNSTASGKAQNRRVEIVIQGAVVAPAR